MWSQASPRARIRGSPTKSVKPASAASSAPTMPAPISQAEASAQNGAPVYR
jgi:hypothetical protein